MISIGWNRSTASKTYGNGVLRRIPVPTTGAPYFVPVEPVAATGVSIRPLGVPKRMPETFVEPWIVAPTPKRPPDHDCVRL